MEYRESTSNHVILCGTVSGELIFSHRTRGERFYETTLNVERLSGRIDTVPVMIPERLADINEDWDGKMVCVAGEMRSYSKWDGNKHRLFLHVFCKYFAECEVGDSANNYITLDGYICKSVNYRETPSGREIADVLLAVNRAYGKSDYIPCICWGRNARFADSLNVGEHIRIYGRVQSREYMKRISEEEYEQRTAYEVSINSLEVIPDAEAQNG